MHCSCKLSNGKQIAGLPERLRPRLFAGLPEAEVNTIVSLARHKHLRASSVVLHEGDAADRLFMLASGQGRQFVTTKVGRKVMLYWLTAGQMLGGMSMLSAPARYLATSQMLTDGCALMWERQTIREIVSRYPVLLDNALSIAATENVAWSIATQVSLSTDDARGRVAHLLVSLACGIGIATPEGVELRITNEDLAAAANVTPFTASRYLAEWQRAGALTKGRGKLVLRRPFLLVSG